LKSCGYFILFAQKRSSGNSKGPQIARISGFKMVRRLRHKWRHRLRAARFAHPAYFRVCPRNAQLLNLTAKSHKSNKFFCLFFFSFFDLFDFAVHPPFIQSCAIPRKSAPLTNYAPLICVNLCNLWTIITRPQLRADTPQARAPCKSRAP
jgi:hypothetical protein